MKKAPESMALFKAFDVLENRRKQAKTGQNNAT